MIIDTRSKRDGAEEKKHNKGDDKQQIDKGHALVTFYASLSSSWILDTRASNHMASYKGMFSSIKPCTNQEVLMGDNT